MSLPPGRTIDEARSQARAYAKLLWTRSDWRAKSEDVRIAELQNFCARLMQGNRTEGDQLANAAIWEGV